MSSDRTRKFLLDAAPGAPLLFVEARAPLEVCRARLQARKHEVSDARADLLDDFAASWESVDSLAAESRMVADTGASVAGAVRAVRRRLG